MDIMNLSGHPVRVKYYVGEGEDKKAVVALIPTAGLEDAPQELLESSHFLALSGVTSKNAKVLKAIARK